MSEDNESKRYSDPELERFVRENKEMIGKLLSEEKRMFKETFAAEKEKMEAKVCEQKAKTKDAVRNMVDTLSDREVQRHFTAAGLELFMGLEALIKASPLNDIMEDVMGRKAPGQDVPEDAPEPAENPKPHLQKIPIAGPDRSSEMDRI